MNIRVLSFDFDGCLFNLQYNASKNQSTESESSVLLSNNVALIEAIRSENEKNKFQHIITMIGSNRQSFDIDHENSIKHGTESCFLAISTISTAINAEFDNLLMADLHSNKEPGTAYRDALERQQSTTPGLFPDTYQWLFDESKVTILYAQMHHIAIKHPMAQIQFDFYDDQSDIHASIQNFFTTHPALIPNNVVLNLYQYTGTILQKISSISGTGNIDDAYPTTVQTFGTLALSTQTGKVSHRIKAIDPTFITPEKLKTFQFETPRLASTNTYEQYSLATVAEGTSSSFHFLDSTRSDLDTNIITNIANEPAPFAHTKPEKLPVLPTLAISAILQRRKKSAANLQPIATTQPPALNDSATSIHSLKIASGSNSPCSPDKRIASMQLASFSSPKSSPKREKKDTPTTPTPF